MYIMVNSNDFYGTTEVVPVDNNVHSDRSAKEQHYKWQTDLFQKVGLDHSASDGSVKATHSYTPH